MTAWWRIDPAEQDETDRAAEGSFASAAAADPMRAAVLEALTKGDVPGDDDGE